MIGLIATVPPHRRKSAELEDVFGNLSPQVRANEPENQLCQLRKSRSAADTYKISEIYSGETALKTLGESAHFQAAGPSFPALRATAPDIEYPRAVG